METISNEFLYIIFQNDFYLGLSYIDRLFFSSPLFISIDLAIFYQQVVQLVKNLPAMQENWVRFLGWEDPLEKEMAIPSSIPAWRIPWTEEPGGLQSMGSQELNTTQRLNHHHEKKISIMQLWTEKKGKNVVNSKRLKSHFCDPWSKFRRYSQSRYSFVLTDFMSS